MSILITFIKLLAVFDLLVIAAYFGRDILSTVWSKFRKKPRREEPFDFSLDAAAVPLSIDSIRQLYSGDAADFVEERLLPNAAQTMAVLTDREQTAARLLLSALVGFLAEEAPMDERSFPMVMELLNCMECEKEDGCQSRVPIKQYLQKFPKWGRFGVTSVTPFLLLPVHPEGCTPAHRT